MPPAILDPRLPCDVRSWDALQRPIWIFDPNGLRGLYANPKALELWGAETLDELLSRDFSQLSPAVRSRVSQLALATADGTALSERWSFYPRGKPLTVQALISSLPLSDGAAVLLFEAAPIVVEQDELRAVEALRHTSSLISLFDADGAALFANPAAWTAYGQEGARFGPRFRTPGRGDASLADVLDGTVLSVLEEVTTLQGARHHYLDARRVTDPVSGAPGVLLSERDVTAQIEAERALRSAEERAGAAEAKQRFLANISHELRTPLNSVLGFAALLQNGALDQVQTGYAARIGEAGEGLLRMVNDLIDLSEIDTGDLKLEAAPFRLSELLDKAARGASAAAAAKGLALTLDGSDAPPTPLLGDARRLALILSHYLENAIKFTEAGQIGLSAAAHAWNPHEVAIESSVQDTGPGLSRARQIGLFQRFSPGEDGMRKRAGGAGLGLALSRGLASLMGGEVGVESEPGRGARFWLRVTLPLAAQDDRPCEPEPPLRWAPEPVETRPLRILYADDHENNRTLVRLLLESQGHACDTVDDGEQAVQAACTGCYDLVLMDIQMPVQDGLSATRAIRGGSAICAQVPILAVTANTLSEQLDDYAAAGMNDCIAKPVRAADLLTRVAYWTAPQPDRFTAMAARA